MKRKVFIIEDDKGWCDALRIFFDACEEFSAEAFTDARLAMEAILASPPDLAVIDLVMPHMGGQEIAELIQENGMPTKVIFLTGLMTPDESRARGYRVGNQTVVGKPVNLGVLMGLARKALAA